MTALDLAWGGGPTSRYEDLAGRFRPVFVRIRDGALAREHERGSLAEPIGWLKETGFTALRLPEAEGGSGASLPELFALLVELAEADSNVVQALRAHFGFVEEVLSTADAARRARWAPRIARGETVGSARSEAGDARQAGFDTVVARDGEAWRLDGRKFYTTGSLYADWIHAAGTRVEDGVSVTAVVRRDAPGVTVLDDWDGFGQRLTASGTALFEGVSIEAENLVEDRTIFPYTLPFYQTVHLATLAGIGRAAATDLAVAVAGRRRAYTHGAAATSAEDPQVLEVVGRVRGAAYVAGAVVEKVAEAVERVFQAVRAGRSFDRLLAIAEVESAQAVPAVSGSILDATTILFDALGASAVLRSQGLDRHWRNARTLTSHNPRIYKARVVGDFAVNGTEPPQSWRVGTTA